MACNGFNPAVSGASNCLASCTPADLFANSQGPSASCLNAGAPTSPALTAALVPLLHTTLTHSSACPPPRRHGVDGTRHSACPPPHRAEGSLWGRASAAAWHCPCPATPRGCVLQPRHQGWLVGCVRARGNTRALRWSLGGGPPKRSRPLSTTRGQPGPPSSATPLPRLPDPLPACDTAQLTSTAVVLMMTIPGASGDPLRAAQGRPCGRAPVEASTAVPPARPCRLASSPRPGLPHGQLGGPGGTSHSVGAPHGWLSCGVVSSPPLTPPALPASRPGHVLRRHGAAQELPAHGDAVLHHLLPDHLHLDDLRLLALLPPGHQGHRRPLPLLAARHGGLEHPPAGAHHPGERVHGAPTCAWAHKWCTSPGRCLTRSPPPPSRFTK